MKRSNMFLSLLLVTFIVGVNALTACGNHTIPQIKEPEQSTAEKMTDSYVRQTEAQAVPMKQRMELNSSANLKKTIEKPTALYQSENRGMKSTEVSQSRSLEKVNEAASEISTTTATAEDANSNAAAQMANVSLEPLVKDQVQQTQNTEETRNPITVSADIVPVVNVTPPDPEDQDMQPLNETGGDPAPDNQPNTEEIEAVISVPAHEHSYVATIIEPTCTEAGYTLYKCECGDSYTADHSAALGHDWTEQTESKIVGQEAHEICGDCGMDLTASGIAGSAIASHAKDHVLSDENASGRTYTVAVDIYQDITIRYCSRCGCSE